MIVSPFRLQSTPLAEVWVPAGAAAAKGRRCWDSGCSAFGSRSQPDEAEGRGWEARGKDDSSESAASLGPQLLERRRFRRPSWHCRVIVKRDARCQLKQELGRYFSIPGRMTREVVRTG